MENKTVNQENEKKLGLAAPWTTYVSELDAMFEQDPDVSILYQEEEREVKIYVTGEKKAEALAQLLNDEVEFGNVKLKITVIPANARNDLDILELYEAAFAGNPAFERALPIESPLGVHRFVMFQNRVVQFYNDQLNDPYGNLSTLYQEIAKDIFKREFAVNYCTEPEDGFEGEDEFANG